MPSPVICIGASLIDELFFCEEKTIPGTSNPAILKRFAGGVVRNIAHQLTLLDIPAKLVTAIGNDPDGDWLMADCLENHLHTGMIKRVHDRTGKYTSILDNDGSLFVAACTDPSEKYLVPELLKQHSAAFKNAALIIADTNLHEETLSWLIVFCKLHAISLIVEPVSVAKARKLARLDLAGTFMLTPNEDELPSLCKNVHHTEQECIDELLQRGVKNVWLRKGPHGSVLFSREGNIVLDGKFIPVADSTGAGDAALAGWIAAYRKGLTALQCLQAGHTMAMEVLQVPGSVIPGFTNEKLFLSIKKYYPDAA